MKRSIIVLIAACASAALPVAPAGAWFNRGDFHAGSYGGHWGAASNGHWASGGWGHSNSGTYGTTSSGEHYATGSNGGSAEAGNGSWSAQGNGKSNSGTYGTTAYGTHYATGQNGAVATNDGHWAAENGGTYAYGSHYGGETTWSGAYHPPTVVNSYYGSGCYNCGGWPAAGAAAVGGLAVGAAVGATAATAANATANANAYAAGVAAGTSYAMGSIYMALPPACVYTPIASTTYYQCNGVWFSPSYGANGVYYRVVPAP